MISPRVLIAPDKFKGTLTADAAARAIARGLGRAWPGTKITRLGLTDGGEGFVEIMVEQAGGRLRTTKTVDAAWNFGAGASRRHRSILAEFPGKWQAPACEFCPRQSARVA